MASELAPDPAPLVGFVKALKEAGVPAPVIETNVDDIPRVLRDAGDVAAAKGLQLDQVLEDEAVRILKAVGYPTEECLKPSELERVGSSERPALSEKRVEHIRSCSRCQALAQASTPPRAGLKRVLAAVRKLPEPAAASTKRERVK